MAYAGIDKRRFAQLLEWGVNDDELRRFFADSRTQLIMNKGKVQNLPHGKTARIRALAYELPTSTDKVIQKWFAENISMADPTPISEVVETFRMFEEARESLPVDEARKLARSCLIHLFGSAPTNELLDYLKPVVNTAMPNNVEAVEEHKGSLPESTAQTDIGRLPSSLASALIALAEGKDPDEHLSSLPAPVASLVAGIHAAKVGKRDEIQAALEALTDQDEVRAFLKGYADRIASDATKGNVAHGLQFVSVSDANETLDFDIDHVEIMAICTKDFPETTVFVRPFAIRTANGAWFSLANNGIREKLFPASGDVIVRAGRGQQQPRRGEIGLWRVAPNEHRNPNHSTNFHVASNKTQVYEVSDVPFPSTNYDNVREYIKDQAESSRHSSPILFLLKDGVIVGLPPGKDLTKDEGFADGLPCWTGVTAIRAEGRVLVPGPLPKSETYECEALASSLRKLLASDKSTSAKPTKAQLKSIQDLITSGGARINALRAQRLRVELGVIEEHEGAVEALLETLMTQPKIAERVDRLVDAMVNAAMAEKEDLQESIDKLRQEKAILTGEKRKLELEQRKMAPETAKAIRSAFEKARSEAIETLGQATVFKALIDEAIERPGFRSEHRVAEIAQPVTALSSMIVRQLIGKSDASIAEMLRSIGVTPKHAAALQIVGQLAQTCGLILLVEGLAARLAAESWLTMAPGSNKILECRIGLMDADAGHELLRDAPSNLAILDANLSPLDVYARPLIDAIQRRIAGLGEHTHDMLVVFSLSNGVASLPIPPVVKAIALQVSLDRRPQFLSDAEAMEKLQEITTSDEPIGWMVHLWKLAAERVKKQLQTMKPEDVALALSILDTNSQDL